MDGVVGMGKKFLEAVGPGEHRFPMSHTPFINIFNQDICVKMGP